MRLIDADKLIEEGYSLERTYRKDSSTMVLERRKIEDIPVVDAVPVVRCEDCKHWWSSEEICDRKRTITSGLWFCADGERRRG